MIINTIIVLLIVVLSIPLKKKSEKLLKKSYVEDDFAIQHKLVDDSIFYNRLFLGLLLFCLVLLLITALF